VNEFEKLKTHLKGEMRKAFNKLNSLFRSLTGNPPTVVEVWNTDLSQIIKPDGALFKDHVSGGIPTHYKSMILETKLYDGKREVKS